MEMKGMAECKAKLGDRGKMRGEKTFNTKSGTKSGGSVQTSWEGTTKGATKSKSGKGG